MMITLIQPNKSDFDQLSLESAFADDSPSMTKQSFRDEADINVLVERFGLGAQLPDAPLPEHFGDFSGAVDFQTSMNLIRRAGEDFMTIPAHIREQFRNDPQQLIDFLGDSGNRQAAIDLGLVPPPPVESIAPPTPSKEVVPVPDVPVGKPADFSR